VQSLTRVFTVQVPRKLSLVFPSADTEREFQRRFGQDALPRYRMVVPLVILMWAGFGVLDHRVFNAHRLEQARILRFAIVTPLLFAVFSLSFMGQQRFSRYWQWSLAFGYSAILASMVYLTSMGDLSKHTHGATAICLVLVGGYTLVMMRFVYAVIISGVATVATAFVFAQRFNTQQMVMDTMDTGMVWLLMANIIGGVACYELEKYRRYKFIQELVIEKERERAEALLSNTLPASIIERLKAGETRPVDAYASVTVLFADLVGFTKAASKMSPRQLVDRLDDLFSEFDELAERQGLQRIKTIGDEYMVVAGAPDIRDDHASAAAALALAMLGAVQSRREQSRDAFDVRIGLHTGPVVAGIIGAHRLHYDVWGDTVNIASRMQSQGLAGRIQVSAAMHKLLAGGFDLDPRGELQIKGRGPMDTYLLRGQRVQQIDPTGGFRDYERAESSKVEHTDVDAIDDRLEL